MNLSLPDITPLETIINPVTHGFALQAHAVLTDVMTRTGLTVNNTKTKLREATTSASTSLGHTFGPFWDRKTGKRYLGAARRGEERDCSLRNRTALTGRPLTHRVRQVGMWEFHATGEVGCPPLFGGCQATEQPRRMDALFRSMWRAGNEWTVTEPSSSEIRDIL